MPRRIREFDWTGHRLGPPESWPQSLKTVVRLMLDSRYAMWMGWGPELTFFYNDAYARDTLGKKHPWALGQPARQVWAEIWPDIGPRIDHVLRSGEATWDEGLLLFLERSGYPEETYHTFSYSPLYDDDGRRGGMLCVVTEETRRVISERRMALLRELGTNTTVARSVDDACARFAQTLTVHPSDVPFALVYLLDDSRGAASLKAAVAVPHDHPARFKEIRLGHPPGQGWPLAEALERNECVIVSELAERFGGFPSGASPNVSHSAVVLPITGVDLKHPAGALVLGANPRRAMDDDYQGFFQLVAGQLATALSNAQSYEKERRRAEALAELDRAKTAFFSNVSHEFRTPLTLMLGPIEELLQLDEAAVSPVVRSQLEVAYRNSVRLLKLVNTLLDFSRLEAGRLQAHFERVDLALFTQDLASAFRSTIEQAGLRFDVDCPPLTEPVAVDRDLWEKIVFNLLSNAFKFTLEGGIRLSLSYENAEVVLRVADTGTGIPAAELPNLFKRFHRVQNARARTHEGTGIGLALVHELVRLHEGSIAVDSEFGQGTTFTARIPLGKSRLPADGVPAGLAEPFKTRHEEVFVPAHWMPVDAVERSSLDESQPAHTAGPRARVLVVDDNADMRDYVGRLLRDRYDLLTARDGCEALELARRGPPDLVLSDVMMPGMDGVGLLYAIRHDAQLKTVPVILLSARAGGEARVDGLEQGADDYLVKPFSGRELTARIETHLKLARLRNEAAEKERRLNQELEQRVEERTASLREAIAQMEEFSYSVSHDLRAPVRAMHGYAQVIDEDYGDRLGPQGKAYLERIVQNAARMDRLIRDLLVYSRMARREVQLSRVALGPLLRDIISQNAAFGPDQAGILVPAELPDVVGHEPSLSQVISNLLSNAVKFVRPGVVPEVRLRSECRDGQVRVFFEDNGIGIRPEHQHRLFGMFERVHPGDTYEGTGIGLAIVRKAMERMGGKVGLESDGVHGSKFWIELSAA
ncbi:MAG: ATP-binding protein [Verrucomicrobiota bacterium]